MCRYFFTILLFVVLGSCGTFTPNTATAQILCNGQICSSDGSPVDLALMQSQIASTPQFVNGGTFIPQNTLRSSFPCNSTILGRYARVNDMYQTVASVAICETDGTTYYWRPQRTDYATTSTQTSGTMTLVPFVTSPVVVLSSSPTGNLNVVASSVNAWPGAQFRILMPATITLPYAITITGLVGNGTLTALQGRDYVITYTAAGWKTN